MLLFSIELCSSIFMYFLICTVYVFNSIQLSVMKRRQWKYHLLPNTPFYRLSPLPLSIAPLHYLSLSPSPSTLPSQICCLPQVFILSAAPHATDQGSFNLDRRRANSPCIFYAFQLRYYCRHCCSIRLPRRRRRYPLRRILNDHISAIHPNMLRFPCTFCGMRFLNHGLLLNHILQQHIDTYPCPVCGLDCTGPQAYALHVRSHSQSGLEVCHICGDSFGNSIALHAHVVSHRRENIWHQCHLCGLRCFVRYHLNQHIRYRHTNTDQ